MSKIHISPNALAQMVQDCTSSHDLIRLYEIVQAYAHPYQLGWMQEQIYKLQIEEKKQQQQQETKK
jgi:hypothetical protein